MVVTDEEQPLLQQTAVFANPEHNVNYDEVLQDFESNDPEDPRNWSPLFKWYIVTLLALMAFTVTFACIGVVPIASKIVEDLDGMQADSSSSTLLVTIWELGEAAGPLLIAPFSEVFGRYPVMNVCNTAFIGTIILAIYSPNSRVFIIARMLTGVTVASNVLNPAIIGDMFDPEQRGSAMSLIMLAPLIGGAIGPTIGGAVAQTMGWRQVLIIATGLAVLCELLFLTCFRETYKMTILRQRATRLRKQNEDLGSPQVVGRQKSLLKMWRSITRPFSVLFGSGVLMLLSLFASVTFSVYYIMAVSAPEILQNAYGLNPAQTGLAFISFSFGSFLSVLVCNFSLDKIYIHLRGPTGAKGKPEYRLPLSIAGGLALPFAVAAYGWTSQWHLPVPVLLLSLAVLGFTLLLAFLPVSSYVVDACGVYSASAMTSVIVSRCLMGTFLPLATGPLAEYLGYGWGLSTLGGLCLCMAVIPILVFTYGEKWRQGSEVMRDI